MPNTWNYNGDVNLQCGGFFWREDGADDYVLCVDIVPCSDAGGPDNLFYVEIGSIYISEDKEKIARALECCGQTLESASRFDIVDAVKAYQGLDRTAGFVVRIGRLDPDARGWNPAPDKVLRAGASLRRHVENNYLD